MTSAAPVSGCQEGNDRDRGPFAGAIQCCQAGQGLVEERRDRMQRWSKGQQRRQQTGLSAVRPDRTSGSDRGARSTSAKEIVNCKPHGAAKLKQ